MNKALREIAAFATGAAIVGGTMACNASLWWVGLIGAGVAYAGSRLIPTNNRPRSEPVAALAPSMTTFDLAIVDLVKAASGLGDDREIKDLILAICTTAKEAARYAQNNHGNAKIEFSVMQTLADATHLISEYVRLLTGSMEIDIRSEARQKLIQSLISLNNLLSDLMKQEVESDISDFEQTVEGVAGRVKRFRGDVIDGG